MAPKDSSGPKSVKPAIRAGDTPVPRAELQEEPDSYPTAALSVALDRAQVDSGAVLREAVGACLTNPAHPINAALTERIRADVNNELVKPCRTIKVPQALSGEQEGALSTAFPEFRLQFTRMVGASHPYSAASRNLEVELLLSQLKYDDTVTVDRDVYIKDVGGNPARHLCRRNIHCCCPPLSVRDVSRLMMARDTAEQRGETLGPRRLCEHKAQHCAVTARYNMYIHSTYDMTCEDIADSMFISKAIRGVGTYVYHDRMVFQDVGTIPILGAHYTMNVERNTIQFTYYDDQDYVHNLAEYRRFASSQVIWTSDRTRAYAVYRRNNRNGVQFFEIVPTYVDHPQVCSLTVAPDLTRSFYIVNSFRLDTTLRVDVPATDTLPWMSTENSVYQLVRIKILVPKRWFDEVLKYAMTLKEGGFTLTAVQNFARAKESRLIINGKEVQGLAEKFTASVQMDASVAAYMLAFRMRYQGTQTVKILTNHEKVRRQRRYKPAFIKSIMGLIHKCIPTSGIPAEHQVRMLMLSDYEYVHGVSLVDAALTFDQHLQVTTDPFDFASGWVQRYDAFGGLECTLKDGVFEVTDNTREEPPVPEPRETDTVSLQSVTMTSQPSTYNIPTPGDGKCLFHAIRLAAGITDSADMLITVARPSVSIDTIPSHLSRDEWGNVDDLQPIAERYGVTLDVDYSMGSEEGHHVVGTSATRVTLTLRSDHYTATLNTRVGSKSVRLENAVRTEIPDPQPLWALHARDPLWQRSTAKSTLACNLQVWEQLVACYSIDDSLNVCGQHCYRTMHTEVQPIPVCTKGDGACALTRNKGLERTGLVYIGVPRSVRTSRHLPNLAKVAEVWMRGVLPILKEGLRDLTSMGNLVLEAPSITECVQPLLALLAHCFHLVELVRLPCRPALGPLTHIVCRRFRSAVPDRMPERHDDFSACVARHTWSWMNELKLAEDMAPSTWSLAPSLKVDSGDAEGVSGADEDREPPNLDELVGGLQSGPLLIIGPGRLTLADYQPITRVTFDAEPLSAVANRDNVAGLLALCRGILSDPARRRGYAWRKLGSLARDLPLATVLYNLACAPGRFTGGGRRLLNVHFTAGDASLQFCKADETYEKVDDLEPKFPGPWISDAEERGTSEMYQQAAHNLDLITAIHAKWVQSPSTTLRVKYYVDGPMPDLRYLDDFWLVDVTTPACECVLGFEKTTNSTPSALREAWYGLQTKVLDALQTHVTPSKSEGASAEHRYPSVLSLSSKYAEPWLHDAEPTATGRIKLKTIHSKWLASPARHLRVRHPCDQEIPRLKHMAAIWAGPGEDPEHCVVVYDKQADEMEPGVADEVDRVSHAAKETHGVEAAPLATEEDLEEPADAWGPPQGGASWDEEIAPVVPRPADDRGTSPTGTPTGIAPGEAPESRDAGASAAPEGNSKGATVRSADDMTLGTSVLVNAANPEFIDGGGVCGLIHTLARRAGRLPEGGLFDYISSRAAPDVVRVSAGFDAYTHVIHAVAPRAGSSGYAVAWRRMIRNLTIALNELPDGAVVGLPLLGAGIYGGDKVAIARDLKAMGKDVKATVTLHLCAGTPGRGDHWKNQAAIKAAIGSGGGGPHILFNRNSVRYAWLSNMSPAKVRGWPTLEHAYQAAKSAFHGFDPERLRGRTAVQAQRITRGIKTKPEWFARNLEVMTDLLWDKFADSDLQQKLLLTTEMLIEDTSNEYWGRGRDGSGRNVLGHLLVSLRDCLRAAGQGPARALGVKEPACSESSGTYETASMNTCEPSTEPKEPIEPTGPLDERPTDDAAAPTEPDEEPKKRRKNRLSKVARRVRRCLQGRRPVNPTFFRHPTEPMSEVGQKHSLLHQSPAAAPMPEATKVTLDPLPRCAPLCSAGALDQVLGRPQTAPPSPGKSPPDEPSRVGSKAGGVVTPTPIWQSPANHLTAKISAAMNFQFEPATDTDPKLRGWKNSFREQLAIWKVTSAVLRSECGTRWSEATLARSQNTLLDFSKRYPTVGLRAAKKWILKPREELDYMCCYNGTEVLGFDSVEALTMVDDHLAIAPEGRLYEVCSALAEDFRGEYDPVQVQGVPGCGKTHYIVTNFSVGDLLLTTTRTAAQDLSRRASARHADYEHVHTIDSYLMNRTSKHDVVWVDEALMRHVGVVHAVALKSRARKVICLGDALQIPYIERVSHIQPAHWAYHFRVDRVLDTSRRCPQDVARAFTSKYRQKAGHDFKSSSNVSRSLELKVITGVASVPRNRTHYLTFTQSDKAQLIAEGFGAPRDSGAPKVNTVHEFQGSESADIALVRLDTSLGKTVFSSDNHVLVGLTRHNRSLIYCTTVPGDVTAGIIAQAKLTGGALTRREVKDRYDVAKEVHEVALQPEEYVFSPALADVVAMECVEDTVNDRTWCLLSEDHEEMLETYAPGSSHMDVALVQAFVDDLTEAAGWEDTSLDADGVAVGDLSIPVADGHIQGYSYTAVTAYSRLEPELWTSCYRPRPRTQIETLLALSKRNLNVPDLSSLTCEVTTAAAMFEGFKEAYLSSTKPFPTLGCSQSSLREWLQTQPQDTLQMIDTSQPLYETRTNVYDFSIKPVVKPCLTASALDVIPALQTIAAQTKFVNAVFCPLARMVKERLQAVLNRTVCIYTDMSAVDYAAKVTAVCPPSGAVGQPVLEVDISKFDKSQGRLALEFEIHFLRHFGFPEDLLRLWRHMHTDTALVDRAHGVRANIMYQRKSGDAFTFLGNTAFNMAACAYAYDLKVARLLCFAGDDSLIIGGATQGDATICFSQALNLEVKLFRYSNHLFCSKFLLPVGDQWVFVPDPLKLAIKLGRHDLVNWRHAEEYRRSLCDLTEEYERTAVWEPLDAAVRERYGGTIGASPVVQTIRALVQHPQSFSHLYMEPAPVRAQPALVLYAPPGFGKTIFSTRTSLTCVSTTDHSVSTREDVLGLLQMADVVLTERHELLRDLPVPLVVCTASYETTLNRLSTRLELDQAQQWAGDVQRFRPRGDVLTLNCDRVYVSHHLTAIEHHARYRRFKLMEDPSLPKLQ